MTGYFGKITTPGTAFAATAFEEKENGAKVAAAFTGGLIDGILIGTLLLKGLSVAGVSL